MVGLYDLVLGNVIQERFARNCCEMSFLLLQENGGKLLFLSILSKETHSSKCYDHHPAAIKGTRNRMKPML